jgi:hypothetical protein
MIASQKTMDIYSKWTKVFFSACKFKELVEKNPADSEYKNYLKELVEEMNALEKLFKTQPDWAECCRLVIHCGEGVVMESKLLVEY